MEKHQFGGVGIHDVLGQVAHQKIDAFSLAFGLCVIGQVFSFGGEADAPWPVSKCRHLGKDVGIRFELKNRRAAIGLFFYFVVAGIAYTPVGHSGHANENVGLRGKCHDCLVHLPGAFYVDAFNPIRAGQRRGAGNQNNPGAGLVRRTSKCIAHFSRRAIGNHANRVDALAGGAGCKQYDFAGQRFGLKKRDKFGQQFIGFKHAPAAGFTTSLLAGCRAQNKNAVITQLPHIALCGRIKPHFTVHGRRYQQRAIASGHT